MYKTVCRILFLFVVLLLAACGYRSLESETLRGRILVWHDWSGDEEQFLNNLLDKFIEIHPEVTIIRKVIPAEVFIDKFSRHAKASVGPDLLIADAFFARQFADAGLIQEIGGETFQTDVYRSTILDVLRNREQGQLYGLPFSLQTSALYYNKQMVTTPPTTLPALLEEAAQGKKVALDTTFLGAFWGIQAFGGQLFDAEGRVLLEEGAFANWLAWLRNAESVPNMIFSNEHDTRYHLFTSGEVAYYVGHSTELPQLQQALGEDGLGVAQLPAGPHQSAGPILQVEALMFGTASDPSERELARQLATFLTNVQQQTKLAREEIGYLPANSRVKSTQDVSEVVRILMQQSQTAVRISWRDVNEFHKLLTSGNDWYVQALEGVVEVNEVATELTEQVEPEPIAHRCPTELEGTLQVVSLSFMFEEEKTAYDKVVENFMNDCPQIIIDSPLWDDDPDIWIYNNEKFNERFIEDPPLDLSPLVKPEFLQQYIPVTVDALKYEGKLYGLPLSLDSMALYYNTNFVSEPAQVLEDLLNQADPSRPIALPISFNDAYWGAPAFGSQLFDEQRRVVLNEGGFSEWLHWLQQAQQQPGIVLLDHRKSYELFVSGQAAYFVGNMSLLNELQAQLGEKQVGVAPLPAGPLGEAGPFLQVKGLALNSQLNETQITLALEFAKYLANEESVSLLMEQAGYIPVNVKMDTSAEPAIQRFLEQAQTAIPWPYGKEMEEVEAWGEVLYEEVLVNGYDPTLTVDSFTDFVNELNGFAVEKAQKAVPCVGEGEVILWHSWTEERATTLSQIIDDFAGDCPDIKVKSKYVPAKLVPAQLSQAVEERKAPDFMLTSHEMILPLSGLIKKITPWVNETLLTQQWPNAIRAFQHKNALYGLPQRFDMMTLYYNPELINEFPLVLDELAALAMPETAVAFDSTFYGASWGVEAFGGQLFDDKGQLLPEQEKLVEWLMWLQNRQEQPGFILSANQKELEEWFTSGEVAFLAAKLDLLPTLQSALGEKKIGIGFIPWGPEEEPRGLIRVEGFLFTQAASDEQTQLALRFAQFASSQRSQTLAAKKANLVPTNKLTSLEIDNDDMEVLIYEARTQLPLPHHPALEQILAAGDMLYEDVLKHDANPTDAVEAFIKSINEGDKVSNDSER